MEEPTTSRWTVIVTGGNHGIGEGISRAFGKRGAKVAVHYVDKPVRERGQNWTAQHRNAGPGAAREVAQAIRDDGGESIIVEGDLLDASIPSRIFDEVERKLGPVNVLINNAASCEEPDTILELTAETIDRTFGVNVRGTLLMIQQFAARFRGSEPSSGRIINISTGPAQCFVGQICYGSSKSAVEALTRSLCHELAPRITVNAIAPGPVPTDLYEAPIPRKVVETMPLGRLGTPRDIGSAALFLASQEADWITGQVIRVSGGRHVGA
jgi:3-oxoacyl-[acyl-carrier protein] reductase